MVLLAASRVLAVVERFRLRLALTLVASVLMLIVALGRATVMKIRTPIARTRSRPPMISNRRKRLKLGMRSFLSFLALSLVGGSNDLVAGSVRPAACSGA